MSNEEIVAKIKGGRNDLKGLLCSQNVGLIISLAKQIKGEFEDLMQEGYLGLLEAVPSYNPEKEIPFVSWAAMIIKGRFYRNNNSLIRIPENLKGDLYRYRRYIELCSKEGITPTDADIAAALFISHGELEAIKTADNATKCCSLQSPAGEAEDSSLQDLIPAPGDLESDAVEQEFQTELEAALWAEVDALPPEQAETIRARYQEGKSLAECSMNNPRARYDERRGLRTLRKSKALQPFYEDIRSDALKGNGSRRFNQTWTSSTERIAIQLVGGEEDDHA